MSNWWESSPVDGNTSDNAASKNWWDEHPKEEASQDSALTRGITQAKSAAKTAKALSIGDYETVAQLAAERDAYRKANPGTKEGNELMSAWDSGDGIAGGIKNVVGEIGKDWKEAPSTFDALRATGKNLSAMGGGIVEQVPNMVMPMAGMLAGGAAGSTVGGPFGAVVGGWAGATAGNAAAESPEQVDRALQSAGIDPQDTAAAKSYLDANGGKIAGQALTKGAIIGAVDTATMGIGGKVLTAPARAAADRALREMGVNLSDKAAVKAAQRTTEFANKIGSDAVYQASQKGAQAFARNTAVGALEPAGEFAGEYFGQGAATGDWDTKGATLEALSSLGQSGITFAGQKAYQYATNPFSKATANTDTPKADVPRVNDYTLVTDPAPIQQRIDAMLRIDRSAINEKERIAYEKAWSDALNEPVGITHDENGIEKPLTMGTYLDAQDQARQIAELRARQNQDPNTATVPNQDGTETVIDRRDGPLSAAAVSSVKNGVLRERDFVPPPTGRFGQMDELANLIDSERQDVEGQRNALVQGQQLRRASELESTDARVEAARIQQTNQQRDALLQNVLENLPEGQNPSRAFDRALRSMGFTDTNFRPEEVRTIQNWNNVIQSAQPETIPSAPNELDAEAMGIRSLDEKQKVIEANRRKFEETRKRIQAQRGGQNGTNAIAPTIPEVATPSLEVGSGELPGSGTVLAPSPIGNSLGTGNRAEVVGPGVRPSMAAGSPGTPGLDNLTQGISNGVETNETFPQETQRTEESAAAVAPEVKGYKLGQAKMISGRMTNQGLPPEIYPHPTQEGMYAIRPIGENNASRSEPARKQPTVETPAAAEQVAAVAPVQAATTAAQETPVEVKSAAPTQERSVEKTESGVVAVKGYPEEQIRAVAKTLGYRVIVGSNGNALFSTGSDAAKIKKELGFVKPKSAPASADKPAEPVGMFIGNRNIGKAHVADEEVTVKNGVVHIGKYPAVNFETGEDVTVPENADPATIRDALQRSGAIEPGLNFYGVPGETKQERDDAKEFNDLYQTESADLASLRENIQPADLPRVDTASAPVASMEQAQPQQTPLQKLIAANKQKKADENAARAAKLAELMAKRKAEKAAAQEEDATNDRDTFTVERVEDNERADVTFKRGEEVKIAGTYPMRTGKIEGISQAQRQFRVDGVWHDFGYAYKTDYDEFASARQDMDKLLSDARQRIADGLGFSHTDGYPIREARALATRYALEGYDATLNELEIEGQRIFDERTKALREEQIAREKAQSDKWQAERDAEAEKYSAPVQMTMDEWKDIHKDYKSYNGGDRTAMIGGRMRAVEIVKPGVEPVVAETAAVEKTETDMTPDWDSFAEFWNGLIEGKGTIDDVKKSFALLVDEADAFRATIAKMKNDQLKRMLGWSARPDDKKADLVRKVYDQTLERFTLNKSAPSKQWTYGEKMEVVEKRYQDQLRAVIDSLTDADLAEFRDSIAENSKERKEALEQKKAAAADPKTLEDFEVYATYSKNTGKTADEARKALTPEQRAAWDSLLAEKSRTARQDSSAQQKAEVKVAAVTTEGQIIETKHTKTGEDLFVVKAAERVERDVYNQWNATAKKLGGWYSSFRGNGAVPGFQFKTRENAQAFLKFLGGDVSEAKESVQERRDAFEDDKSQSAVDRLNDMADRLDERADESLGRDRKANTDRRARFAAAAEASAQSDKALAKTMRNIAKAIQDGTAKLLDRVRQKTQVEMLQEFVRNAKDAELRSKYPAYIDQERHKGEPADIDTAEFAQWPTYSAERSDLANLARQLLETDGTKKLGQQLLKIADDITAEYKKFAKENLYKVSVFSASREGSSEKTQAVFPTEEAAERAIARSGFKGKATTISFKRGEHLVIMGPTMARERGVWQGDDNKRITLAPDYGELLVEKLGKMARTNRDAPRIPWQFENAYDKRKRLAAIGIETPAEFRSALREFIGLREQAKAPDRVKELERSMIGRKNDGLDFFPTPKNVAQQMIDAAEIKEGMSVLEPSAGWGHIAEQIRDAGIDPDVVELSNDRKELLEAKGFRVVGRDFMDVEQRSFFTFGDVFKAPDGTIGVMRGNGGMGSNRVGLQPLDENGKPDERRKQWVNRDDLTEVEKRGLDSGYDRILMNPPFSDRRDAQHVQHAYSLLRPGGRLVAIMGEGVFFGQDKKAEAFRNWLDEVGGTSEQLEAGTFLDSSLPVNTGVNARMVVIDKPAGQAAPVDTENTGPGSQANDGRITPADKAIYGMAAEGKSAADILKFIADTSRNPFYRQLARLLQKTGIAPKIVVGTSDGWKFNAGEGKYAAAYNPKTDTVALFRPASSERNMLHELIHSATLKALSKRGMAAVQMKKLFEHVAKSGKLKGMYGMANVDEFVAEAFSNPKFQAMLKQVSAAPVGGKPSSAWDWFIRVVRGILGLKQGHDNALSQALDIGVGVMRENMALQSGDGVIRFNHALRSTPEGNRPINAIRLANLRRIAAGLERPKDAVFLRVTEDGKAITTGPKGVRIPETFIRFAESNGLDFEARRNGDGRKSDGHTVGDHITSKTEPMPEEYRESGALYFGEGNEFFDRTGKTRYNAAPGKINQTDTEAFKRWFGDSAVVDSDGKPLRVFHGTASDITAFDIGRSGESTGNTGFYGAGAYFSEDADYASGFSFWARRSDDQAPNVVPVYLSLKNPAYINITPRSQAASEKSRATAEKIISTMVARGTDKAVVDKLQGFVSENKFEPFMGTLYNALGGGTGTTALLKEAGFDGVTIYGGISGKEKLAEAVAFDPTQIKSAIGNSGDFDATNPDIRYNIIGDSGRAYDARHRSFFKNVGRDVDRQNVIEKTLDYLKSDFWKKMAVGIVDQFRGLRDLNDGGQAYLLARLSKGTAGAFDTLLHHGKLSLKDGVYDGDTSGGFVERLGVPLNGELDDFLWWVAANRAEGLTAQGKENLFSPQDIQAGKSLAAGLTTFDYTIQTGQSQGATTRNRQVIYQDALRVFNEFQKNVLDLSEQSGLIDGASRKHWESEFYVPFYRVSEEDGEFVGAKMGNALVRQQAFKKLKGGTDKLNSDLLTNTLMNLSHLIEASAKNRAATAALTAAEKIGAARKAIHGEKHTVWHMDKGQKVEYKVEDPFVMTAITSLEYAGMRNGVMDAMTKFKHWLTIGVTASPAFKVRNLIRDSIQAIGTSDLSYNPIKNVTEGFKQTKRDSQAYVSALASGGLIRFGTMLEGSESNRVRQLIKSGVKDSSILNNEAKWRQFYDKYIEPAVSAYNELGNRSEEINRAALYNQLIKQGKSHGEAALMARDLMDFGMMGSFNTIRFLGQVVPFFNARLQGMYKLGRSAKDNPKKLAVVTGAVAVASIALMLGYDDDEDWKRREDWDRDGFWWFKFGGVEYRIPKPFEVGAVASLAERSVEYLINDEMTGERFRKVVGALAMNNLSMNPVPQMVKPMIDLYANKDSFTGRPIESMSMERLEKTMRFNSNTSMPARGLSNATLGLLSPVQYDHLARAYFGWLGAFAVGGADMAYRAVSDEPTQPALDYFKFFSQGILKEEGTGSSRYLSNLYDQASELETVYSTYRQLLKDGKAEDASEYAADNTDELRRYKSVEAIKKVQTRMNQNIRVIERDPDMAADEKKIRIDRIQKMKEQFAKRISPGA